jgi:hypothetical protein
VAVPSRLPVDLVGTRLTVPPALSLGKQENGNTKFIPATLAAFRSIDNNEVVAAHGNEP